MHPMALDLVRQVTRDTSALCVGTPHVDYPGIGMKNPGGGRGGGRTSKIPPAGALPWLKRSCVLISVMASPAPIPRVNTTMLRRRSPRPGLHLVLLLMWTSVIYRRLTPCYLGTRTWPRRSMTLPFPRTVRLPMANHSPLRRSPRCQHLQPCPYTPWTTSKMTNATHPSCLSPPSRVLLKNTLPPRPQAWGCSTAPSQRWSEKHSTGTPQGRARAL